MVQGHRSPSRWYLLLVIGVAGWTQELEASSCACGRASSYVASQLGARLRLVVVGCCRSEVLD